MGITNKQSPQDTEIRNLGLDIWQRLKKVSSYEKYTKNNDKIAINILKHFCEYVKYVISKVQVSKFSCTHLLLTYYTGVCNYLREIYWTNLMAIEILNELMYI